MKQAIVYGLLIGLIALISAPAAASGFGFTAGFEPTGLWILGAMTELSVIEFIDVRAQIGFATQQIEGLMLATLSVVPHWLMPPVDPFVGIGMGVALTPPPYSTGIVVEASGGVRLVPADVVSILLQARYLMRWTGTAWTAGPVFEGGILINF
jgi:hypothetical protein